MKKTDSPESIKARLFDLAGELGFPFGGATSARLPSPHIERLRRWLDQGCADRMDYLARGLRQDQGLDEWLSGARTVLTFGYPYGPLTWGHSVPILPIDPVGPGEAGGRISLHALGRHYHRIIEPRLRRIRREIESIGGRAWAYVDYGPPLQKAYAYEAGMGFFGRNGCLIHPYWGSFFFIGLVVTDLELPRDRPCEEACRDCGRCRKACPTGALREDATVDARRCISYLTVEHRGAVPDGLAARFGSWVLGCDACQWSCPHNRVRSDEARWDCVRDRHWPRIGLSRIAQMNEEEFARRFTGTSLRRPGHATMGRNIRIAMSNRRNWRPGGEEPKGEGQ